VHELAWSTDTLLDDGSNCSVVLPLHHLLQLQKVVEALHEVYAEVYRMYILVARVPTAVI
jgi:hypothetical protein